MSTSHFALAAALLLAATPAFADDSAGDADNGAIIVVGRADADPAQAAAASTPGGTDIVRYEDYADKSPASLRDVLAFSPGVYLQPRYGQEVRISIRGSGISRGYHMRGLALLQDGIPINLADDNGDFQELEPIFFDHLEVYRGANALRFGSGTLGGAVNGVTPTGRTAPGLFVRADAGSFSTARSLVSAGVQDGAVDGWAAISADTSNGDRGHARRSSVRFHGNVGLELSPAISTRFYASANNINQQLPGALTAATTLSAPRTGSYVGNQARDIDSIRLQNRTTIATGAGTLELGAFYNVKSLYHPIFQVVDQEGEDRGAFFRFDAGQHGALAFTLGGEIRAGGIASKRFVNLNGNRGALTFQADQAARTANLYAEARVTPMAGLTLIAGGIYADGWRTQHELFNSFAGGARDVRARAEFSEFSPKFGLLFEPSNSVQIFANYSRSAEFPGFIELAQVSQFVPVAAQTAWTAEVGTRGDMGIIHWDVTAYRADIKGEMLQYVVSADIPASTFNAGRTRHQGVEIGLDIQPNDWLRLRQTYTYSDFRFRGDVQFGNNRLPVVPRHAYRAELRLGGDALHIAPNVEWMPKGAMADYANTTRTPGYALIGLSGGAQVMRGLDLFVDARNLTGKKAIGDISAVITATAASAIYYPVEGRAVFGGFRVRF